MTPTDLIGPAVVAAIVSGVVSILGSIFSNRTTKRLHQEKLDADERLAERRFGFDVELLYIARKLKYSIKPVAVRMIHHRLGSRVQLVSHSLEMLTDLFQIRLNDLKGKYK